MEGRHCFAHLTIEENLLTGAYTRSATARRGRARPGEGLQLLPAPEDARRTSQAAYTSGGEQQMCAIGRALMANPKMVLLDEPSMGLAPQIVEEVFEIVKDLNTKEKVTFLLAEQNTNMALRYADYGYILENGRIVMDGAAYLRENEDVKEFYLGMGGGDRKAASRPPRSSRTKRCSAPGASLRDGWVPRASAATAVRAEGARAIASSRSAARDEGLGGEAPERASSPMDPQAWSGSAAARLRPTS